MDPITLLTSASSITERGPLRRVLPAGALITLLIGLLVSGAASGPPNISRVAYQLQHLGVVGAGVLVISVAASAVFIAPVFGYLSGVLQGTMMTGPLLYPVRAVLTRRHRKRHDGLVNRRHALADHLRDAGTQTDHDRVGLSDIDIQLSRASVGDPRPTTLGNVLAAANDYPDQRYGLDATVTLPRLLRVVPAEVLPVVDGQRQDLQFATEMSGALFLAAVMSAGFLITDGRWLTVPATAFLLAWLSYRNAVSAAVVYGETQRVLFDLYRFSLYDALQIPRPTRSGAEERRIGAEISALLWRGSDEPRDYQHAPPCHTDTIEGPPHQAKRTSSLRSAFSRRRSPPTS